MSILPPAGVVLGAQDEGNNPVSERERRTESRTRESNPDIELMDPNIGTVNQKRPETNPLHDVAKRVELPQHSRRIDSMKRITESNYLEALKDS